MIETTTRTILLGLCTILTTLACLLWLTVTGAAQTSTAEKINGASTSTTKQEHGTVEYVGGNTLVLRMSTGQVRTLTVPDSRTAVVDGKEITMHDLKVGTTLTATITTITTPVTERTVSKLNGTVWFVNGNSVILTLPDGENKLFQPKPDVTFTVGDRKATVADLRKGMKVYVEKIVEAPITEVANNTTVSGHAPKARPTVPR